MRVAGSRRAAEAAGTSMVSPRVRTREMPASLESASLTRAGSNPVVEVAAGTSCYGWFLNGEPRWGRGYVFRRKGRLDGDRSDSDESTDGEESADGDSEESVYYDAGENVESAEQSMCDEDDVDDQEGEQDDDEDL